MNVIKIFIIVSLISLNFSLGRTKVQILKSNEKGLTIKISRGVKTSADVYPDYIYIGLPSNNRPDIKTISFQESISPFQTKKMSKSLFEVSSIQKHQNLNIAVIKINPVIKNNKFLNGLP